MRSPRTAALAVFTLLSSVIASANDATDSAKKAAIAHVSKRFGDSLAVKQAAADKAAKELKIKGYTKATMEAAKRTAADLKAARGILPELLADDVYLVNEKGTVLPQQALDVSKADTVPQGLLVGITRRATIVPAGGFGAGGGDKALPNPPFFLVLKGASKPAFGEELPSVRGYYRIESEVRAAGQTVPVVVPLNLTPADVAGGN